MKHPPSLLRSFWDIFKKKEFFAKKFFWVWIKLCKSEGQTFQCSDIVFNIYIYISYSITPWTVCLYICVSVPGFVPANFKAAYLPHYAK